MHGRKDRMGHGPDVWASVSPKAQILASLAVLVPVALSGLALVALAPPFWWVFTTYFWVSFPALGLLVRGLEELSGNAAGSSTGRGKEREILEALREHGDLTAAGAAMETSLSVAEADGVLEGLAEGGHLEVRARGGALSYALWQPQDTGGAERKVREPYSEPGLKLLKAGGGETRQDVERSGI